MGRLRSVSRSSLGLVIAAFGLIVPGVSLADPSPTVDPLDAEDRPESGEPPKGTPLWVALTGQLAEGSGRTQLGFIVAIGGSFERLAGPRKLRPARRHERPSTDPAFDSFEDPVEPLGTPEREIDLASDQPESESGGAPRVADGPFARALVRAALRASNRGAKEDRLDGLATRAKASALLPEVRVRVGSNLDEVVALAPTATDPQRLTSKDGAKLLVEGRATFKLDRLVFADEEVQVEKLRLERERLEKALTDEILGDLATWQRAQLASHDPSLAGDAAIENEVAALAATEALDVLSDGWFSAHMHDMPQARLPASARARSPLRHKEKRAPTSVARATSTPARAPVSAAWEREAVRPGAAP